MTESNAWMRSGGTSIPAGIGAGGRVYVTLPGAPKPPGTGPCRIEFFIASRALQLAGHTQWKQLLQPIQNVPVYNVRIFVP
jgi:filamentous hemagglutinin